MLRYSGRRRGRRRLRVRGAVAGHPDQLRHLRDPDQRPAPGHRAAVHRLHAAARERREEHQLHRTTRCRCTAPRAAYQEIVAGRPGVHGHRRGPGPRPLLQPTTASPRPRPRRGVHRNEGRTMTSATTTHAEARRRARRAKSACGPGCSAARYGVDVGVLRLRAAVAHRAVLRHHRRASAIPASAARWTTHRRLATRSTCE